MFLRKAFSSELFYALFHVSWASVTSWIMKNIRENCKLATTHVTTLNVKMDIFIDEMTFQNNLIIKKINIFRNSGYGVA